MSKIFKQHEIIGYLMIDGRKVTYLKTGVKRLHKYQDHLMDEHMDHLNHQLIYLQKYGEFLRNVIGMDDFSHES